MPELVNMHGGFLCLQYLAAQNLRSRRTTTTTPPNNHLRGLLSAVGVLAKCLVLRVDRLKNRTLLSNPISWLVASQDVSPVSTDYQRGTFPDNRASSSWGAFQRGVPGRLSVVSVRSTPSVAVAGRCRLVFCLVLAAGRSGARREGWQMLRAYGAASRTFRTVADLRSVAEPSLVL